MANPNKIAPVRNHHALPWREMGGFMAQLVEREGIAARAAQFSTLAACRSDEMRGLTWAEIDLNAKLWTIPAEMLHPQPGSGCNLASSITLPDGT